MVENRCFLSPRRTCTDTYDSGVIEGADVLSSWRADSIRASNFALSRIVETKDSRAASNMGRRRLRSWAYLIKVEVF